MADYSEHAGLLKQALGGLFLVLVGQREWVWQWALAGRGQGPGARGFSFAHFDSDMFVFLSGADSHRQWLWTKASAKRLKSKCDDETVWF